MRSYLIFILFLLLPACSSTQNTIQLNSWLNHQLGQVEQAQKQMLHQFPISHAQYITLTKHTNNAPLNQLANAVKQMQSAREEYLPRAKALMTKSNQMRQLWRSKAQIKKEDPDWQPTVEFKDFADSEFKSLWKIKNQYHQAQNKFNQVVTLSEFDPYRRLLPRSLWQAKQVLQIYELELNYENYNRSALVHLSSQLEETNQDFITLAKYADLKQLANVNLRKFGRFPNGVSGLSKETEAQAKQMLNKAINPKIVQAALVYAQKQSDINSAYQNLKPLQQGPFIGLAQVISSDNLRVINEAFRQKKSDMLNQIIAQDQQENAVLRQQQDSGFNQLIKVVKLNRTFVERYSVILKEPEIHQHLINNQQYRLKLLTTLEPQITAQIKAAESPSQLKLSFDSFTLEADHSSDLVKRLKQLQAQQLAKLMQFKPVFNEADLTISSFTANNLNYETELTAIYLGDFKHARLTSQSMATTLLLDGYIQAYGRYCHRYLPNNKVPITQSKCATEEVRTNGWGTEVGRNCIRWVDVPTGLYADPVLYELSKKLGLKAGVNLMAKSFSQDMFASRTVLDDKLSLGDDMDRLIKTNQCNNAGLKRFEQNLYNFIVGRSAQTLATGETLADVRGIYNNKVSANSINLVNLIDDLIRENAKGWMLNRYQNGSVNNVKVIGKDKEGGPARINARYRVNALGKNYVGNVVLVFANKIPQCLYFSDAPKTCRHPSRGIINLYEKGHYSR